MRSFHRRTVLKAGVGALSGFGLLGKVTKVMAQGSSVVIGEAKGAGQSAQLPLGVYGGYFKRQGLDVSIRLFNSGAQMGPALIAGSLKMIMSGDIPSIPMMAAGAPVKALCPISDFASDQAIVASKTIKKPEDLVGKKVALFKGSVASLLIARYLTAYNLDLKHVNLIHMDPLQQIPALAAGDIDALVNWEPNIWTAVERVPGARVLARGNEPKHFIRVYDLLLIREDYLKENGETVRKVLTGLAEAQKALSTEQGIADAAKYIHDNEKISIPVDELKKMIKRRNYTMRIDKKFIELEKENTQFLFEMGKIKQKPDVLSWLDPEPLRKAQPQLVSI